MSNKIKKYVGLMLFVIACFAGSVAAQNSLDDETTNVGASNLTAINLPRGARLVKERSVPGEIRETLAKLIAAGGDKIKQGDSEVIIWAGNYKKTTGAQMVGNLENALRNAGWEYEIGEKNAEFVVFSLFRETPERRAAVGFFVPSEEAFIFAAAEMVRADAPNQIVKNKNEAKVKSVGNNSSLAGKWFRTRGGGQVDFTGKTRYKAGEDFYFTFHPDGTLEYAREKDVLTIMQCRIKASDYARGKYSVSGGNLTLSFAAMQVENSNSCDSDENFKKTLAATSKTVSFQIRRMESLARPDKPLLLCFDGAGDDDCYERVKE